MICFGCDNSYIDETSIDCKKGNTPYWSEQEECEECKYFKRRITKEEIEEARAEEEISWRRDNGL